MNLQELELAIAEANQKIEQIKAELLAAKQAKKELERKQKTIKKNIDKAAKLINQTSELSGTNHDDVIDAIKTELSNIAEAANPVDNDSAITTADPAVSDAHLMQATDSLKHLQPQNADDSAHDTQLNPIKENLETQLALLTLGERAIIAKNLNLKTSSDLYNYLADATRKEIDILVRELEEITPKNAPKITPNLPQNHVQQPTKVRVAKTQFKDVPLQKLNLPAHIEENLSKHSTKITNVVKLIDFVLVPLITSDKNHKYVRRLISKEDQQAILNKLQETLNLVVERDGYSVKCYTNSPYPQIAA